MSKKKKSRPRFFSIRRLLKGIKWFGLLASVSFIVGFGFPKGIRKVGHYFTVKKILVTGNRLISSETIREAMGLSTGENIFSVNTKEIKQILRNLPNVKNVVVRKLFPDIIEVHFEEHIPIAILRGEYPVLVDREGTVLEFDLSSGKVDLPVLSGIRSEGEGEISPERMERALAILEIIRKESFPTRISEINVSDPDNVMLYPDQKPICILLGGKKWEERLNKLSFAWNQITANLKPGARLDLRFRRQIVLKPWHRTRGFEG